MYSLIAGKYLEKTEVISVIQIYFHNVSVSWLNINCSNTADILLEQEELTGDFNITLNVYTNIEMDIKELALFCSTKWCTELIISNNEMNPYTWIMVSPNGSIKNVSQIPTDDGRFLIL
ncbi:hypothetical protein DVR12_17840 [Chitinophaga silvatica]|uniref:Uncharacterized protein n=1 Tax=Chitinophaga silvatica TaxID=2282649 RepID=A0A3E1Y829_9BACT|nr:hypothetical protein [Chitinophaga silvatica]RFS21196.1 hypothetical protein DVR12_17840 [Chitinophaga silvatica]